MVELILFIDRRMRQVTNPEISGESGFVEAAAAPAAVESSTPAAPAASVPAEAVTLPAPATPAPAAEPAPTP